MRTIAVSVCEIQAWYCDEQGQKSEDDLDISVLIDSTA